MSTKNPLLSSLFWVLAKAPESTVGRAYCPPRTSKCLEGIKVIFDKHIPRQRSDQPSEFF